MESFALRLHSPMDDVVRAVQANPCCARNPSSRREGATASSPTGRENNSPTNLDLRSGETTR